MAALKVRFTIFIGIMSRIFFLAVKTPTRTHFVMFIQDNKKAPNNRDTGIKT